MSPKRILRIRPVRQIRRVRKAGPLNVTRAEFDTVIKLLNKRSETINALRRELYATCRDLSTQVEKNRQTLEIQFTRITQLQQEIDALKKYLRPESPN